MSEKSQGTSSTGDDKNGDKPGDNKNQKSKKELHKEDPELCSDDSDDGDADEVDGAAMLRQLMGSLSLGAAGRRREKPEQVLGEVSFDGVVELVRSGRATNIVTLAGAGISTSAGIPDFRSPGSGLYDNLQKYDLPDPQAIFSLDYFRQNPQPFFSLAKELYPGSFRPTPSHLFVRLLQDRGLLLRHYTQNIDTLERQAGVDGEKLVEAHGTFHTAHCIVCRKEHSQQFVKEAVFADSVPSCEDCNGVVKPDIVFFGEALPERFHRLAAADLRRCDLLIVMGTSLTVQPFAGLVDMVSDTCPRLLINMNKVGNTGIDFLSRLLMGGAGGMDFDSEDCYRDVAKLGPCDDGVQEMVDKLGWTAEFNALLAKHGHPIKEDNQDKAQSSKGQTRDVKEESKPQTKL